MATMPKKPKAQPEPLHWVRSTEDEERPLVVRGKNAVVHQGKRGLRSSRFPDLNIGATAEKLGVTKSHLGKVLAGTNRPSVQLALQLADVLGKSLDYVVRLYNEPEKPKSGPHRKKK